MITQNCQIGTKIGVVVDMDPMIMIVVTKSQKGKKDKRQKGKNTKRQKDKKAKRQKDKKTKRLKYNNANRQKDKKTKKTKKKQELEQGGHRPPKF